MSSSATKPDSELTENTSEESKTPAAGLTLQAGDRGALQALLAFSSLHQQAQKRLEREMRAGAREAAEEAWEMEQFLLDEVLQLVAERAMAITGADGVAVALAEGDDIVCRGSAGEIAPDAGALLDPNSGFSGACFRTGEIIRCDDAESDPRVNVQAARRLGAGSMVAVPLVGKGCIVGLVEAFGYEAHSFNDSDVRSLKLLAELILAAVRPEEEERLAEISRRVTARALAPAQGVEKPAIPEDVTPEPLNESALETQVEQEPAERPKLDSATTSLPGIKVVVVVLLVAMGLGAGLWWKISRKSNLPRVEAHANPPAATQPKTPPANDPISQIAEPAQSDGETPTSVALAVLPQVTGIRHWTSAEASTVVIDLQDQVQYEAHRLTNPERIYFDLHDTSLAQALAGKTIEVGDPLVSRVRVAQPVPGVTRVVLETNGGSNFAVSLEANPYRLVVAVRGLGTKSHPTTQSDLFPPPTKDKSTTSPGPVPGHAAAFRVVLDAGHGGWDLGTVGRQGLLEKDLVLDIVQRVGGLLEKHTGADVIYTRQDDNYIALEKRAEVANQAQADLFVSVHANYSDLPSARGIETYYTNTFSSANAHSHDGDPGLQQLQTVGFARVDIRAKVKHSRELAVDIQRSLYGALAGTNPGIRNRGVKEASYVVLTGTSMPAVLAEVSFVSSPADESRLQSSAYRQQIADALYKGIARYVGEPRPVRVAAASGKPVVLRIQNSK